MPSSESHNLFTENKKFVLDINNRASEETVRKLIFALRGTVVKTIDSSNLPAVVISDGRYKHFLQSKAHDDQMKILKVLPLILKDAVSHKVPIVSIEKFVEQAKKALGSLQINPHKRPEPSLNSSIMDRDSPPSRVRIEDNHVVIRDPDPNYAVLLKIVDPIVLHVGADFGNSLFDQAKANLKQKRADEIRDDENKGIEYQYFVDEPFKEHVFPEMVREQIGYCDFCRRAVEDVFTHSKTAEHLKKVEQHMNAGFFDELDGIMSKYNSFEFKPIPNRWSNNNATPPKKEDNNRRYTPKKFEPKDLSSPTTDDSVVPQTPSISEAEKRIASDEYDSDECPLNQLLKKQMHQQPR